MHIEVLFHAHFNAIASASLHLQFFHTFVQQEWSEMQYTLYDKHTEGRNNDATFCKPHLLTPNTSLFLFKSNLFP